METIVLFVLPAVVLVAAAVMGFALVKEAFAPRSRLAANRAGPPELPLLRGDELRRWAQDHSKAVFAKYLSQPWTKAAAAAAARDVEGEASRIVDAVSPPTCRSSSSFCQERGEGAIYVTMPEALAIAEQLRSHLPRAQVRRVLKTACANLEASTNSTEGSPKDQACVCPLLGDDGHCLVFAARPLRCRAMSKTFRQNVEQDAVEGKEFFATVSEGMREGFASALTAAGRDGHCYELNGSLVQSLNESGFAG